MDIMELGAIGELVGGVAVIGSLIYVGIQIRHGAAAARSSAHHTASAASTAMLLRATEHQTYEILRSANESYEDLSEQERIASDNHWMANFNYFELLYYDHLEGTVHPDIWSSRVTRFKKMFRERPSSRRAWKKNANLYGHSFRVFVDAHIHPDPSA